jgi:putative hemolysin
MVSSRKSRLDNAAKRGDQSAKKALELSQNPGNFYRTVQIGITLIGILTGIFSGGKKFKTILKIDSTSIRHCSHIVTH